MIKLATDAKTRKGREVRRIIAGEARVLVDLDKIMQELHK